MVSSVRRHISIDPDSKRVTWNLPCSKTDSRAIGKFRSWDCVCGDDFGKPCAFHALLLHCKRLDERFADRPNLENLPLFPDPDGNTARKNDVVRLIEQAATRLGLTTHSPQGSRLFGGHSLRVSGAQWLARLGVPLPLMQSTSISRFSSGKLAVAGHSVQQNSRSPMIAVPLLLAAPSVSVVKTLTQKTPCLADDHLGFSRHPPVHQQGR